MIELRWIISEGDKERILQYRYRYPLRSDSIKAYPPEDWAWSEWLNVPDVPAS